LARQDRATSARLVGQALAIDAEVLSYPLNVLASFVEGECTAGFSRITVRSHPLRHPAAGSVIGRERQGIRSAFVLPDLAEEGRAELGVEGRIDEEARVVECDAGAARGRSRRRWQKLHQALGASARGRLPEEFAFLAG